MNEDQLRDFQTWSLPRLKNYLLKETGQVEDPDWLDNFLRPEIMRAMAHITRATSQGWLKHRSVYELMGLDFTLDDQLNLWFIEGNTRPALVGYSYERGEILKAMLRDLWDIMFRLVRSRMKRVIDLMNDMADEIPEDCTDKAILSRYADKYRSRFKSAARNGFEPEFEPTEYNTWYPVIDENHAGTKRYFDLLPEECLDYNF